MGLYGYTALILRVVSKAVPPLTVGSRQRGSERGERGEGRGGRGEGEGGGGRGEGGGGRGEGRGERGEGRGGRGEGGGERGEGGGGRGEGRGGRGEGEGGRRVNMLLIIAQRGEVHNCMEYNHVHVHVCQRQYTCKT